MSHRLCRRSILFAISVLGGCSWVRSPAAVTTYVTRHYTAPNPDDTTSRIAVGRFAKLTGARVTQLLPPDCWAFSLRDGLDVLIHALRCLGSITLRVNHDPCRWPPATAPPASARRACAGSGRGVSPPDACAACRADSLPAPTSASPACGACSSPRSRRRGSSAFAIPACGAHYSGAGRVWARPIRRITKPRRSESTKRGIPRPPSRLRVWFRALALSCFRDRSRAGQCPALGYLGSYHAAVNSTSSKAKAALAHPRRSVLKAGEIHLLVARAACAHSP